MESISSASNSQPTRTAMNHAQRWRRRSELDLLISAVTLAALLLPLHAQLLHPVDMLALHSIQSYMGDLPGGNFFASWVFALTVNPCQSFSGVQCAPVDNFNRVTSLALGPQMAGLPGLAGALPPAIGDLAYLQSLTIAAGALRGPIPDAIGNLANLQTFSCSQNFLSGGIPATFANLRNLEILQVRKNALTGGIPAAVAAIPALKVLIMSDNQLSGTIPSFAASALVHLDLRNNDFSGNLPDLPPSMQYLSLTKNLVGGPIDALASLTSLSYLDLSFNQFSGSIPSAVFGFPLSFLLLNRNQFSGEVQVPGLVTIPVVDLSHNRLQGGISPYLAGTQSLFLNNNQFVGTVPQDFVNHMEAATLQSLYLQHNYLTNFGSLGSASLPPSVAVCVQYNCMPPPPQSLCPPNVAGPAARPGYQCLKATGSPG